MWGHLNNKLGNTDWNNTLQKLGNAVAPPPVDDDGYDYEDYGDEEYEDESDYADEEEDEGNFEDEDVDQKAGYGLVGLLSRALDQAQPDDQEVDNINGESRLPNDLRDYAEGETTFQSASNKVDAEIDGLRSIESENHVKLQPTNEDNINPNPEAKSLQLKIGLESQSITVGEIDGLIKIPNKNNQVLNDEVNSQLEMNNVLSIEKCASSNGNVTQKTILDQKSVERDGNNFNRRAVENYTNPITSEREKIPKKVADMGQEHESRNNDTSKNAKAVASFADVENRYRNRLIEAESRALELEKRLASETDQFGEAQDRLILNFKEKEVRLLKASAEEHQQEIRLLEQRYIQRVDSLEESLAKERSEHNREKQKSKLLVQQSISRAEQAESDLRTSLKKHENLLSQASLKEQRAIRITEEKLAQSLALLDERNDEVAKLKQLVVDLESSMNEHAEGAEEAEQEVEELENENEGLQEQLEALENECAGLKAKVSSLQADSAKLGTLQTELKILREERDLERAKNDSMVQSTITSHSQMETERDTAMAEVRDLQQKLTAAYADLEIAKNDKDRALIANNNLQSALEAFQDERQAEISLFDDQRIEHENSLKLAHAAAVDVIQQTHSAEIEQVRTEADIKLKESVDQVEALKNSLEKAKMENAQMRRSLDEAIHRLQTTQEDVIDRTLMKNILLDWCTMKDKTKRQQVLQLMANVLHFTESEKEAVHLTNLNLESMSAKVVGALAAPLPPSKADVEQLQGSNVSEKWVNFLLAETDDGF